MSGKWVKKEEVTPNFNMDLGFVLRLNSILDEITMARVNKEGIKWADWIMAAYMEILPELSGEEISKAETLRTEILKETTAMQTNPKKAKLTSNLYHTCWNFEVFSRRMLVKYGLFNTKKAKFPEDTF